MRIIITLLTAMSLLLNSSCGNTANIQTDEHSGSESENITTTEILENTSEPQNKNILPITFELCDLPDEPFDMAEADNVQVLMNFEAVVLGRSVKCETTISHKMDDPFTYLYFATCTDADSGEIFLRGYDIDFCDPNGDGSLEVLVSDHLIIEKNGAYMSADLKAPFMKYHAPLIPGNADYSFSVRASSGDGSYIPRNRKYLDFYYRITYDSENRFEEHTIQGIFKDDQVELVYENSYSRDLNAQYESNNPDWRVETSFTEIPYYENRTEKLYTLTILGPDDKSYSFYEINQYLYSDYFKALPGAAEISGNMLPISDYCDARYDRKLIVHPEYDQAVLIYPYAVETSADMTGTMALLIDLATGEFRRMSPGQLLREASEFSAPDTLDFMGFNSRHMTIDADVADDGFVMKACLCENDGSVVVSRTKVIELTYPIFDTE